MRHILLRDPKIHQLDSAATINNEFIILEHSMQASGSPRSSRALISRTTMSSMARPGGSIAVELWNTSQMADRGDGE